MDIEIDKYRGNSVSYDKYGVIFQPKIFRQNTIN